MPVDYSEFSLPPVPAYDAAQKMFEYEAQPVMDEEVGTDDTDEDDDETKRLIVKIK